MQYKKQLQREIIKQTYCRKCGMPLYSQIEEPGIKKFCEECSAMIEKIELDKYEKSIKAFTIKTEEEEKEKFEAAVLKIQEKIKNEQNSQNI